MLIVRRNFLYLSILFFIFLFLATNYQRSESSLKQLEKEVVAAAVAAKIGVYKGDTAVNIQLLNALGEPVNLKDFRGKKVLINFFATWCAPCQEEMPILVDLDSRINNEKFVILGVNVTKQEPNPNQVREFIRHYQVEYDILFDGEGKVMKDYQLIGIPTTIFIDEKGKIIKRLNGMLTMDMVENDPFFKLQ